MARPLKYDHTGLRGVSFDKRRGTYEWELKRGGKRMRGRSATLEEATEARECALNQFFRLTATSAVMQVQ